MIIDIETIATNIYNACKDIDYSDYIETSDMDKKNLISAISKIRSYSDYNKDFNTLASALEMLFDN